MRIYCSSITYEFNCIRKELEKGINKLAVENAFVLSEEIEKFEMSLASYLGRKESIGVGSGTDALYLSLLAADIGNGDEVITVGNICVAVMEAIIRSGATPVFVDICSDSFFMNPVQVQKAVSSKTKAIILVHPYGMPAKIKEISDIAQTEGLLLIEACGQAFGAKLRGRPVGSFGTIGCFSFNPDKIIGGLGDGGAVATDDCEIARRVRKLRDHGREEVGMEADIVGYSSRIDAINALAVSLKLKYIDQWIEMRHKKAGLYRQMLEETELVLQKEFSERIPSYQMFVALVPGDRFSLHDRLKAKGIYTDFHYRMPPYKMTAFKKYQIRKQGDLPVTEHLLNHIISLPFYTGIKESEMKYVAEEIIKETKKNF